jgi:ParB family chromosome partitioning protein
MTRRGLGRGLAALIPSTSTGVEAVDVDVIVPNPHQPRSPIDDASLAELVESIREHGVLQPLVVSAGESPGVYQLVAGERRLRAARLAGLATVPVVVKDVASRELLEIALVENLQREDLNPLEEALAYRRLADEFAMTQEAIATRVGKSRTAVANSMRLLSLNDEMKASLASGAISEGHARALLAVDDAKTRTDLWRQITERGLTVRETEAMARGRRSDRRGKRMGAGRGADPEVTALEENLRVALGTKLELRRDAKGQGRLVLYFHSDDELAGLLERLGVSTG